MELPPKLCPQCGEEYLHTVATCVDCGVALVAEGELPRAAATEPGRALPPTAELVALRSADPAWIRILSEALQAEGVPHRVALGQAGSRGRPGSCTLLVLPEDAERAARVDAEVARAQIPDLPEDASPRWVESDACPACGSPLDVGASECGGCGLVFGSQE